LFDVNIRQPWILISIAVAMFGTAVWFVNRPNSSTPVTTASQVASTPDQLLKSPTGRDDLSGGLLDQMNSSNSGPGTASTPRAVQTNEQLETLHAEANSLARQARALAQEAAAASKAGDSQGASQKAAAAKAVGASLEQKLLSFQGDLRLARAARPDDPVVQWLSGELLMQVGGAPEEILPFLQHAVDRGLNRSDLFTSLARVRFEANQFERAYQSGLKALALDAQNPSAWEVFAGVALALEHFRELIERVDSAFPATKPDWASAIRGRANGLLDEWTQEQARRAKQEAAHNLPIVRLTIDHQAFESDSDGLTRRQTKSSGRDVVDVELFEDDAPATVANFVNLVESGFYNGTRFHWTEAASMAVGGDPNSKNSDPSDDGLGGPGYVIPDEFDLPGARPHLRGTLTMVETAPRTAGSQFLIAVTAHPAFDHHLTAFGRVFRGQEGIDRITVGRTNLRVGRSGKIIPGDLLVRAEVMRKRPHPYRTVKDDR
jgi:cyclophilin family peptidyl-prolyl cis-trans isomerase